VQPVYCLGIHSPRSPHVDDHSDVSLPCNLRPYLVFFLVYDSPTHSFSPQSPPSFSKTSSIPDTELITYKIVGIARRNGSSERFRQPVRANLFALIMVLHACLILSEP
jgi:hypothetical protein